MNSEASLNPPELVNAINWIADSGQRQLFIDGLATSTYTFNIAGKGFRKKSMSGSMMGEFYLSHAYLGKRDSVILVVKPICNIVDVFGSKMWSIELPLTDIKKFRTETDVLAYFGEIIAKYREHTEGRSEREEKKQNVLSGGLVEQEFYADDAEYGAFS